MSKRKTLRRLYKGLLANRRANRKEIANKRSIANTVFADNANKMVDYKTHAIETYIWIMGGLIIKLGLMCREQIIIVHYTIAHVASHQQSVNCVMTD